MQVEIWSDVACPWCYVGKRHFEQALEGFEHRDAVAVTWRAFELDPAAPPERTGDYASHVSRKYGRSLEEAREMLSRMTIAAAQSGLDLHFDEMRTGSTFDAHRLIRLGAAHGRQGAVKERLMRAYLTEGRLMSDHATLVQLAAEAGLPEHEAAETLATGRYTDDVRADERLAQAMGIAAVPFFVVERRFGGAGAQPPEVFADLLTQAWESVGETAADAGSPDPGDR